MTDTPLRFVCDAMLGGLARWLRAAGYDTAWQAGIDDWDLIRQARREGRVLLSSDTGIFKIGIIRDGDVPNLFIPNGLDTPTQLAFTLEHLRLPLLAPRCMACGGELAEVSKESVRDQVPARSYERVEQVHRCERCGRLFWRGTHWEKIGERLQQSSKSLSCPESK